MQSSGHPTGRFARRALVVAMIVALLTDPLAALAADLTVPALVRDIAPIATSVPLSLPRTAAAAPLSEPLVFVDPALPDSWYGWRRTPTTVRVIAPGETVMYRWDGDVGEWSVAEGPIFVPEGRHVLHLAALSASSSRDRIGAPRWTRDVPLRVAFKSSPLPPSPRLRQAAERLQDSGSVVLNVTIKPTAGPTLVQIGGRDRYETAALISKNNFSSAPTVILATGQDFADALAASGLAGSHEAPLLLTNRGSLPAVTLTEMRRLKAKTCIIVGGPAAVSAVVENRVRSAGFTVQRIGGADRYATAALIAGAIEKREGAASLAFLARGDNFPDALAVSPFAYNAKCPIVLTRPSVLPDPSRQIISRGYIATLVIAGGTAAVSSGVEGTVRGYVTSVSRAGGADRYETAAKAAQKGIALGLTRGAMIGIATGENFPDALCGGAATGKQDGMILLTRKNTLPTPTGRMVSDCGPYLRHVQVYGGPAAVSAAVIEALRAIIRS